MQRGSYWNRCHYIALLDCLIDFKSLKSDNLTIKKNGRNRIYLRQH